jgi:hypothetical protein
MGDDATRLYDLAEVNALWDAAVILGGAVIDAKAALSAAFKAERRAYAAYLDAFATLKESPE